MAHWHGLAKLRMHLTSTLDSLTDVTEQLGTALRSFRDDLCPNFKTHETERESQARHRRASKSNAATTPGKKEKEFSLSTYKLHALGDYPSTIRAFGTSDNYSTQTVCLRNVIPVWRLAHSLS